MAVSGIFPKADKQKTPVKPALRAEKKSEARSLYARAGVQFPGSAVQDGLSCSILVADNPVNGNFAEQAWKLCSSMRKERKK